MTYIYVLAAPALSGADGRHSPRPDGVRGPEQVGFHEARGRKYGSYVPPGSWSLSMSDVRWTPL
jgi:hypothetical protein